MVPAFSGVLASWDPNPESDLAGYNIYFGTSSGNYDQSIDVGNNVEWFTNNLVISAVYYFAVTAYDSSNNESPFSREASLLITGIAGGVDFIEECTEVRAYNIRGQEVGLDRSQLPSGFYIRRCFVGGKVAWTKSEVLVK